MSAVAVIPSRLGSTRLPEKALLRETGKYLIQHVWERVRASARIGRVIVATDHPRILEAADRVEVGGQRRRARHEWMPELQPEVTRGEIHQSLRSPCDASSW